MFKKANFHKFTHSTTAKKMLLRPLIKKFASAQGVVVPTRLFANFFDDSKDFQLDKDWHRKEYVTLKLNRAPVNSFNLNFLKDLVYQLEMFEENKTLKGVIITSVTNLGSLLFNESIFSFISSYFVLLTYLGHSKSVFGRNRSNGVVRF